MNNSESDARTFFRDLSRGLAVILLAGGLVACSGSPSSGGKPPSKEEGKDVFGKPTWSTSNDEIAGPNAPTSPTTPGGRPNAAMAPAAEARKTWAILLGVMSGADAERQAMTLAAIARQEGGMNDAFLEKRGDGLAVLFGAYEDPGSDEAKRDLAKARAVRIADGQPFASAIMAAPTVRGVAGSVPEYDLRNAKQFSRDAAKFTLQVGIYLRSDNRKPSADEITEFRKAAEDAVRQLRAAGEEAFYYHGPEKSTITIGLFADERDVRIQEIRKRHPFNMVNGQRTTNARVEAGRGGQESFLVGTPK